MKNDTDEKTMFKKFDNFFYHEKDIILQPSETAFLKDYFTKKKGWLYIMVNEDHDFLKIGRTTKTPMKRAKSLSNTGVLTDYEVLFSIQSFNQVITEKELFAKLKKYRVQGEFFNCNPHIAITEMNKIIESESKRLSPHLNLELINLDFSLFEQAIKIHTANTHNL